MAQRYHRYRVGRRWLIVLAVVACLIFHLVVVARVFLSPEQFRVRTQMLLQRVSPGACEVGSAGYNFPSEFRIDGIALSRAEEKGGGKLFGCKALKIHFSWLALLRGQMVLEDLVLEQPELDLLKDDLVFQPKEPPPEQPKAKVDRVVIRGGRIGLGEGILFSTGDAASPAQELRNIDVELTRERHRANAFAFEGSADSDLWGRCDISGVADMTRRVLDVNLLARQIAIDEKLRALLPARTLRSLDRFGVKGSVDFSVQTTVAWGKDVKGSPLRAVEASIELCDCTAAWEKIPIPITGIRGKLVFDGTNIYYRDIVARAGGADITLNGVVKGDRIETTLAVRGRPLDRTLRDNLYPKLQAVWDRCGVEKGILDLDYRSTWIREGKLLEITAESHVRDVAAVYSMFPYRLSDVTGTVRWEGRGEETDVVGGSTLESLRGRHGNASIEVNGTISDPGVPNLVIKAQDLPFDQDLRDALPDIRKPIFDDLKPQGSGSVVLEITSPTGNPKELSYRISIRPEGASFQYREFRHRITDVRGEVRIDEKGSVTFHNLEGKLGDIHLQFRGGVRMGEDKPIPDITIVAPEIELSPTTRALLTEGWQKVYDQLSPQGKVALTWKIGMDPRTGKPKESTEIRCIQDCSIQHKRFPVRITGLTGRVFVDDTGRTAFTDMRGHIGKATIEAVDGVYGTGAEKGLRLALKATGLAFTKDIYDALDKKQQEVWDSFQPTGEASVLYTYNEVETPDKPLSTVSIEPSDAAFTYKPFPLPVTDVIRGKIAIDQDGNVTASNILGKLRGKTVQLSGKLSASAGKSSAQLDVEVTELTLGKELRGTLPKSLQATWDRFQPSGTASATASLRVALPSGAWESFQLKATLKDVAATFDRLPVPLTNLRGEIEYQDGMVHLTDIEGRSPLADLVRLDGRHHETEGYRIRVRADGVKIARPLLQHLPKDVSAALEALNLRGTMDVDLTVAQAAKPGATVLGSVRLQNCTFKQRYDFENVSGSLNVTKGTLQDNGSHAFAGTMTLQRLVAEGYEFSDIAGGFTFTKPSDAPGRLALRNIGGSFYGGRVSAKADIDFATDKAPALWLSLSAVDFRQLCKEALGAKKPGSGALSLRIDFPPSRERTDGDLIGDGEALVQNGDLGQLPLAASLFNVIGFRSPLDRGVTRAELKFGIAEKHVVVDHFTLSGDNQLMTGWGTAGYDRKLDLTFYAPKKGTILTDIIRVLPDNLIEVKVEGTISEPVTRMNPVPVIPRALKAFNTVFTFWRESRPDAPRP